MSANEYLQELQRGVSLGNGKYLIEKTIGSGGFGITYLARHVKSNTAYAIKEFFPTGRCARDTQRNTVIPQGVRTEIYEKYRNKFIEEAQMLASFDHPNIVKVADVFEENNTSYIVMHFVRGNTVQQIIERQGRMSLVVAVDLITQLCDAIGYIHARNLLHRDIKPDNIIITPKDSVVLIDFGAARQFVQDQMQNHTVILTPCYAPYEQYTPTSRKGTYSDIYSLGATFYFMVTGQVPVDALNRMSKLMPSPKDLNPEISDKVNAIIMKAMNLKPADRYQEAKDLLNDLLGNVNRQTVSPAGINATIDKVLTFGRNNNNDVVIPDDKLVSRHHLQIIRYRNGKFVLKDFSTNGTFVNGVKITGEVELNKNDIVRIGNTLLPWMLRFDDTATNSGQSGTSDNDTDIDTGKQCTKIHVYRDNSIWSFGKLYLNGDYIVDMKYNRKKTITVNKSGVHVLSSKTGVKEDFSLNVELGKEYYIRYSLMGFFMGHPKFTLMNPDKAKAEMKES
ncbi:MAG: protein kinase [Prevotellaceae bacterium]|jgi:serine/threonine protein kinase|nr:protein kinase [Prevotellaceae bacterium]